MFPNSNNLSFVSNDKIKSYLNVVQNNIFYKLDASFKEYKNELYQIKNELNSKLEQNFQFLFNLNKLNKNNIINFIQTKTFNFSILSNKNKNLLPECEFIKDKDLNNIKINKIDIYNSINNINMPAKQITLKIKNSGQINWPNNCIITNNNLEKLFRVYYKIEKELKPNEEITCNVNIFLNISDLNDKEYKLNLIVLDNNKKRIGNGCLEIIIQIVSTIYNIDPNSDKYVIDKKIIIIKLKVNLKI